MTERSLARRHPMRTVLSQARKDPLQKRCGDALFRGDLRQRHRVAVVVTGEVDHRPEAIFAAR